MTEPFDIHTDNIFNPDKSGPAVTTVGTFDGVHLGHRKILGELSSGSGQEMIRTVVTFEPHPQNMMRKRPGIVPIITDTEQKVRLLRREGVDRVLILKFTEELAKLSAEDFLKQILLGKLNSKKLVVGFNHAFGEGRKGTCEFLRSVKEKYGFELKVVEPHFVGEETVSSSKIRNALMSGEIEKTNAFLGRPYCLRGIVIPGEGRGRQLNFPTANIEPIPKHRLIPKYGVYAAAVRHNHTVYPGMLNIGVKPTFGGKDLSIEIHLIGFSGELYGEVITLQFLQYLRSERKFDNSDELTQQLTKDKEDSLQAYHHHKSEDLQVEKFC
ncbi:riboflavin biosynthesis protein RibF [candidate division LCP-89 bacterium B3_LCP]|uniref:Riboflavin biosynthesis protein n=1 Tax=candidate division LCP-89 bacterium B3_LCP TaxID=2012998 RepID=A0A532V398_UNCL8|nr:MAG: riboflavin biosynthesis protein RibF [candidate division LCP-89 bacterium B3_LCP]